MFVFALFNFQGPLLSLFRSRSFVTAYLSYHTSKLLSRVFFKLFSKFFRRAGFHSSPFLPENPLFMRFSHSFLRSLVRQLCYHTTYFSFCQLFFSNFFHLLQIVYFSRHKRLVSLFSFYNLYFSFKSYSNRLKCPSAVATDHIPIIYSSYAVISTSHSHCLAFSPNFPFRPAMPNVS